MIVRNKRQWIAALLLVLGFCLICIFSATSVMAAEAPANQEGTLIIQERTSDKDTAKESPFAIQISGVDNNYSTTAYVEENGSWSTRLPAGTYVATEIVPMEYQCQKAEQTFTIESGKSQTITFENQYTKKGYFRSRDVAVNHVKKGELLSRYQVDVTAGVREGYPPTEPVDMVMLLDVSDSMNRPMEAADGSTETRMRRMQDTLYAFLCKLKKNVSGDSRIAVVTFSNTVETILGLSELESMTEEELHTLVYEITVGANATRTDLGIMEVYQMMKDIRIENRKQHLLLFTDGTPTSGADFKTVQSANADRLKVQYSGAYKTNNFRIMAETVNVANVLRGTGTVTTNYKMQGLIWENLTFDFYGVPLKSGGKWTDLNAWDQNTEITAGLTTYSEKVEAMRNQAIWSSAEGGNYERVAQGLGITVHAVGIFDPVDYVYTNTVTQKEINNYLYVEQFLQDSSDKYYLPADPDDLAKSFESIFEDMVLPQRWKAEMVVDTGFEVLDADGASVEILPDGSSKLSWSGKQISRDWSDECHPILREKKADNAETPKVTVTYYKTNQQGDIIQEFDQQTEVYWDYEITKIR